MRKGLKIFLALMLAQVMAGTAFSEEDRSLATRANIPTPWTLVASPTPGFFATPVGGGSYAAPSESLTPVTAGSNWRNVRTGPSIQRGGYGGGGYGRGYGRGYGGGYGQGGGDKWFPISRRLGFSVWAEEELNDNIFESSNKESDSILHFTPSLSYNLTPRVLTKFKNIPLGLNWNLSLTSETYMKHTELNEFRWYGGTGLTPAFVFDTSLWQRFHFHYDIRTGNVKVSDIDSTATNQQKRDLLTTVNQTVAFDAALGPKDRLWYLNYTHTDTFYVQKQYQGAGNSMDDYLSIIHDFRTASRIPYIGTSAESTRYTKKGRDNTLIWLGFAGLRGQFGGKLGGDIRAGVSHVTADQNAGNEGKTSFYTRASLEYWMTSRITMRLDIGQEPQASADIQRNYELVDTASLTINYLPPFFERRMTSSTGITYTKNNYDYAGARSDKDSGTAVSTDTSGTDEKTYEIFSTLSYRANKWLTLSAEYRFRMRNSNASNTSDGLNAANASNADYTNNIFYLRAGGSF